MKGLGRDIVLSVLIGLVIPGILLNYMVLLLEEKPPVQETIPLQTQPPYETIDLKVSVRDAEGLVTEKNMDDYLIGVVLAEMPASFEPEALKAQAVVARTYTRKASVTGGKHGDGSVCTLPSCCQGYTAEDQYLTSSGNQEDLEKVRSAVLSTSGQVLTFEGNLIEATYFSCSGGTTEDAVAVWGTDYPYLRSVDSPGEEDAAYFIDTATFTPEELENKLDVTLSGLPNTWVDAVTYTSGGGVDTICIGGKFFRGTEVRTLLGLRSTAFDISATENLVTITTRGYGHRVGMSQYGADAMAVTGSTYEEILAYYYPGTRIDKLHSVE